MAVSQISLEKEYAKKTGIRPEDIKKLREWLNTQPHLPKDHITDLDLILTYNCCEKSFAVTKHVLDLNYTLKTLFTNFFKDRIVDNKILHNLETVLLQPLATKTKEGYAVFYCRLLDYEPKNLEFARSVRSVLMILDLWQYEEGTWPGFLLIFDLDQLKLGHLPRLDLQSIQQFLYFLQASILPSTVTPNISYPAKLERYLKWTKNIRKKKKEAMLVNLKGFHFLNAPSFMDRFMMMLKPFMKKELLDMLKIHQIGSRTFDEYVPLAALPKESGGNYKTYNELRDEAIARMKANADYFLAENKKRVVESLRPGKPKTISDIFGSIEGSFKKLDID